LERAFRILSLIEVTLACFNAHGAAMLLSSSVYAHLHRLLMLGSPEELETKLPALVVPDAMVGFRAEVDAVRELLSDRVLYSRPSYAALDIAQLRLPPTRVSSSVTPRTWCSHNRRFS
jgi:hypothetical protein